MGTKDDDETGPETDVKDEPKSIDKVEKKMIELAKERDERNKTKMENLHAEI